MDNSSKKPYEIEIISMPFPSSMLGMIKFISSSTKYLPVTDWRWSIDLNNPSRISKYGAEWVETASLVASNAYFPSTISNKNNLVVWVSIFIPKTDAFIIVSLMFYLITIL